MPYGSVFGNLHPVSVVVGVGIIVGGHFLDAFLGEHRVLTKRAKPLVYIPRCGNQASVTHVKPLNPDSERNVFPFSSRQIPRITLGNGKLFRIREFLIYVRVTHTQRLENALLNKL